MTNEKITAMPVKKTQIYLTATLSLEVSQDGVVFETENTVYYLTYARRPAEIEVMCA